MEATPGERLAMRYHRGSHNAVTMMNTANSTPARDFDFVRSRLLRREEIAFLDVREEAPHAEGHPLFAANLPCSRIELDAYTKMPRLDVPVVTLDNGEGLAEIAADRLVSLGYTNVAVFDGGLDAWRAAGGELFIDVNVPSKAFGELMEAACHTPSLSAQEVKAMIDGGEDMVIVDVRRFDEFRTMSIPTAVSVPGAELVLRVPDLAPDPRTKVIVNCAGRTRSLVGTQSLRNAGLRNPVAALRNGTIGWLLAGQTLDNGSDRTFASTPPESAAAAAERARAVANGVGVGRASMADLAAWSRQEMRTTYRFDVRSAAEYEAGHLPGFLSTPGGQLVQETEMAAPVRGARIVLADDDGARANMTASWLAQMDWEVYVLDGATATEFSETGPFVPRMAERPDHRLATAAELDAWLRSDDDVVVVDLSKLAGYRRRHVPGAWFILRSRLREDVVTLPRASRYVLTCPDGNLSAFAAPELAAETGADVFVLNGGVDAWSDGGFKVETGETRLASPPIDRYRRPYEGTNASAEAMQAYLDWEFGLIEQLGRDGTHHFRPTPLAAPPV